MRKYTYSKAWRALERVLLRLDSDQHLKLLAQVAALVCHENNKDIVAFVQAVEIEFAALKVVAAAECLEGEA